MAKKRTFEPWETEYTDPATGRQPWKEIRKWDLSWRDEYGRKWTKPSDIFLPGYADSCPPSRPIRRRRKEIEKGDAQ
jgi:hypothetical protein